ncbi:MAG TPA: diguanylate cyclase [Terriglobales bacterium]|nr:diguanylate cyclase [Terriglobales bacterium]
MDVSTIITAGSLSGCAALLLLSWLLARGRRLRLREAARRVHEFEILTHIGTSLSSSLDGEALLRSIHSELRKLMDVSNFYVAFLDEERDEIRFGLEVEDGVVQEARRRRRGNGLTEYIMRSGQPLLIAGDVASYGRTLGLAPSGRNAKNYLGVPLILKGQSIGVLAVQSYEREDAYDAEHLRVIEILAGQAAVALDNARLFAAVQRDAGHKAFLHQIARLAISTLNPTEMLETVVAQIGAAFPFQRIAIAMPRPNGREGEFEECAATGESEPEACAVELPIRHGGQRLGILHLEADAPRGFRGDQFVVLQTLCDQIAAALHHANLFQQMQHQAITDSLTGLKTRRFFMEALQAEWRRARAATARGEHAHFCVMLLDLDEFKPLNDSFGHLEGDRILVRVAQLLDNKSRASSVVARYGGDEFTVLAPDCEPEAARSMPQRILEAMADDPVLTTHGVKGSIGLALYPDDGLTPEELLHSADAAMYASKQLQPHRGRIRGGRAWGAGQNVS